MYRIRFMLVLFLVAITMAACTRALSPEEQQQVADLQAELERVRAELASAEAKSAGGARTLSPEEQQQVADLQAELERVRVDITSAETANAKLAGGLVKALIEARLEILKTTEALIQQRIHAIEAGVPIEMTLTGTNPDPELAARLAEEMTKLEADLAAARAEAAKYSGGLIAAVTNATVATHEQTLAMLRQQYVAAKYGLAVPTISLQNAGATTPATVPTSVDPASIPSDMLPSDVRKEIISVRLLDKRFDDTDIQEYIWFDIEFTAAGLDKPARAIKGTLILQDLFGEPQMYIGWTIDEPLQPGQVFVEKGSGFRFNRFMEEHQWVLATSLDNMTASFAVESILYTDGTRRDFDPLP
jgi:hypothetical protein